MLFGKYRVSYVGPSTTHPGHLKYALFVDGKHEGYKTFHSPAAAIAWVSDKNAEAVSYPEGEPK